ncbi:MULTISPECIES: sigma factor [Pseudomonas]|uniref:sigma factor n=1 Tax=Pseudomonas TaxID=286 RepID=UPI00386208CC|nr:DNA-directed RNA polymerase specialized sigma24 family protein [Pseudomonas putida]
MADEKLQFYLAHRAALLDYAAPIVGCRARAEDVVQEAWLRFSRQQDDADIRHPASYLYRIVRNLALDQTRRTATEKAQPRRRAVDRCAGQGGAGSPGWATGQAG